jgi:hypothetical protein
MTVSPRRNLCSWHYTCNLNRTLPDSMSVSGMYKPLPFYNPTSAVRGANRISSQVATALDEPSRSITTNPILNAPPTRKRAEHSDIFVAIEQLRSELAALRRQTLDGESDRMSSHKTGHSQHNLSAADYALAYDDNLGFVGAEHHYVDDDGMRTWPRCTFQSISDTAIDQFLLWLMGGRMINTADFLGDHKCDMWSNKHRSRNCPCTAPKKLLNTGTFVEIGANDGVHSKRSEGRTLRAREASDERSLTRARALSASAHTRTTSSTLPIQCPTRGSSRNTSGGEACASRCAGTRVPVELCVMAPRRSGARSTDASEIATCNA